MLFLKQGAAVTIKMGPFVDASDGVTPEDALTIQKADVRLSKNGGDYGACSTDQGESDAGAPHDELGEYDIALGTGDTDTVGRLKVLVAKSGALPVWAEFTVLPANVYDSLIGGTDKLQVHADEITAGLITATAIANDAITAAKLASDVTTELQSGLATSAELAAIEGKIDTIDGVADAVKVVTDKLDDTLEQNDETWRFTAEALAEAPSGGGSGPTAEQIADAVLDEALSGHSSAGTLGKAIADINAAVDTEIAAIKAKTDLIPADPATETTLAGLATAADLAALDGKADAILEDTGTTLPATLSTIAGYVDTEVAAIKAKTDNLPAQPAAKGDIPSASDIAAAVAERQIADGYSAAGAQPTMQQAILEIRQFLMEKAVAGTTVTVRKPNGETTAFTLTLDDDTSPTGITRGA